MAAERLEALDAGTPDGSASWRRLWDSWPEREPFAHPEYARLFARPGDRVAALSFEAPGRRVLFPLILRPLAAEPWAAAGEARWDATTPYGYGGPYAWGPETAADARFWEAFGAWCRRERVVSAFARLSLFPGQLASVPGGGETRLANVVVPLEGGPEAVWAGYESKVRKWVKTAEAAGLTAETDLAGDRLQDFFAVYTSTMTRHAASSFYFFPLEFFRALVERLPGCFAFFHTLHAGRVVSSDLVLLSRDYAYYFLGGTLEEAFDLGPNYLLKSHIARWACAQGKKGYVLGGGVQEGDGLYRYKRAYTRKGETPFKVACLVQDEPACRELEARRAAFEAAAGKPWTPRPLYFPPYRS